MYLESKKLFKSMNPNQNELLLRALAELLGATQKPLNPAQTQASEDARVSSLLADDGKGLSNASAEDKDLVRGQILSCLKGMGY